MTHPHTIVDHPAAQDGDAIMEIARSIDIFEEYDVECIRELWESTLNDGDESGYTFRVARRESKVVGFACYGIRTLTQGAYDLYWIAVHQQHHRQRIGDVLMKDMEQDVKNKGGRLLIIETGGKPAFEPTRKFYERMGYDLEARIRDFYSVGDDLVIYTKHL
jgi:GNAT superfamily N-acetyltransferase